MVMNELFWLGVVWVVGIALLAWWRLEMAIVVLLATVPIFNSAVYFWGSTTLLELGFTPVPGFGDATSSYETLATSIFHVSRDVQRR